MSKYLPPLNQNSDSPKRNIDTLKPNAINSSDQRKSSLSSVKLNPIKVTKNKHSGPGKSPNHIKIKSDAPPFYSNTQSLRLQCESLSDKVNQNSRNNNFGLTHEVSHNNLKPINEIAKYKNPNKLEDRIKKLQDELESSKILNQENINNLYIEKEEIHLKYINLTQEISKIEKCNKNLEESYKVLEKSKNEIEQLYKGLEQRNFNLEQSNKSLEKSKNNLEQSNNTLEQSKKYLQQSNNELEQSIKILEQDNNKLKELKEKYQKSNEGTSQKLFEMEKIIQDYKEFELNILDENTKIKNEIKIYLKNNSSLSEHLNKSSIKSKDLENLNQEKQKQIEILNNEISVLKQEIDNLKKHLKSNIQEELQNIRSIVVDANKYSRSCSQKLIQIDQYKFDEKYGGIKETYDSLQQEIHELLLEDQSRSIKPTN